MKNRRQVFAILACIPLVATALWASYADLQASLVSFDASSVTVSVHNPESQAEAARIAVGVQYSDNTTETIVSPTINFPAGSTRTVTISATKTIVAIGDDPQPFPPL